MKYLKKETIGLTCSPATMLDNKVETVTELLISYGGGMGGASERVYGHIENEKEDTLDFVDYLGTRTIYNKRFIVSIKPKQLVTIVVDILPHLTYGGKECKVNKAIQTTHYVFDTLTEVHFDETNFKQHKEKLSQFVEN